MEDIFDSQYPGSEEQRMVRKVARAMQISREKRCADLLFNSTEFQTEYSGKPHNRCTMERNRRESFD